MKIKKSLLTLLCLSLTTFSLSSCDMVNDVLDFINEDIFGDILGIEISHHHDMQYYDEEPATCESEGTIIYKCSKCDETKIEYTPRLDHDLYYYYTIEGNCVEPQTDVYKCYECNQEIYEESDIYGDHYYEGNYCIYCYEKADFTSSLMFSLQDDDTYAVTGLDSFEDEVIIPEYYNGKAVTRIKSYAFQYFNIEYVDLPDTITCIEEYAFDNCYYLSEINLPDDLSYIGEYAFNNCYYLNEIHLPDGLSYIGDYAFNNCDDLDSINLPDNLTYLGSSAFRDCDSLDNVTIGDKLDYIPDYVFYDCDELYSVSLGEKVELIDEHAFSNCDYLSHVTVPNHAIDIDLHAFDSCPLQYNYYNGAGYLGNIYNPYVILMTYEAIDYNPTIHYDTKMINSYAFSNCNFSYVEIPGNIEYLADGAFYSCSNLTYVTIPNKAFEISNNAFYDCNNIQYNVYNDCYYLGNDYNPYVAFISPISTTESTYSINYSTKVIVDYAFGNCYNLSYIEIPSSVEIIGEGTFYYCTSLYSVTMNYGLKILGNGAFYYCTDLYSIVLPNSIKKIGYLLCEGSSINTIYYCGSEEEFANIDIHYENIAFTEAYIVYNY